MTAIRTPQQRCSLIAGWVSAESRLDTDHLLAGAALFVLSAEARTVTHELGVASRSSEPTCRAEAELWLARYQLHWECSPERCLAHVNAAWAVVPPRNDALILRVAALQDLGRVEEAWDSLSRFEGMAVEWPHGYELLCDIAARLGRETDLERLAALPPPRGRLLAERPSVMGADDGQLGRRVALETVGEYWSSVVVGEWSAVTERVDQTMRRRRRGRGSLV